MAPIHDTDIASERWSKAEWQHYELWEKIEVRLRRRKWLWISGAIAIFLLLSSIPILMDRIPKWHALSASRRLAQELNDLKNLAAIEHHAFRITFKSGLAFEIEKSADCSKAGTPVRSGSLFNGAKAEKFTLLSPEQGLELGIPGLVRSFCFDPLAGSASAELVGFAISPVKDLTEKRADRVSVLLLKGPSAEISFD